MWDPKAGNAGAVKGMFLKGSDLPAWKSSRHVSSQADRILSLLHPAAAVEEVIAVTRSRAQADRTQGAPLPGRVKSVCLRAERISEISPERRSIT